MRQLTNKAPATFESVWISLQETDRILAETALLQQETDRIVKETSESMKETDRIAKETSQMVKETTRAVKEMSRTIGSWSNNHGSFAEEYFFNSFENGKQNFFGEKFDAIEKNAKGIKKDFFDEYDILLINGTSVGIIEVKFKAHTDHIPKVLNKALTFRENFPYYAGHQVYLGLATLSFDTNVEQECIHHGIAVIKQVGDTVVINDEHLKVY